MYQLQYVVNLNGKDIAFWLQAKSIKKLFLAYDELKRDHPKAYLRVQGMTLPDGKFVR